MLDLSIEDIKIIVNAIKSNSNYDLSQYSAKSLKRRLDRILGDRNCTVEKLISKLPDSYYLEELVKDITVNTTEILRDPKLWIYLKNNILPTFKDNEKLRIWHAGCSNGQELYSMLLILNELEMLDKVKSTGTDLNTDVLDNAKKGNYKYQLSLDFIDNFKTVFGNDSDIINKYFEVNTQKDRLNVIPELISIPSFKKHDLVTEQNISTQNFDIIMCRNVLIYFDFALQNRIFEMFYNSLNKGGYLIIGLHEAIMGNISKKFKKLDFQTYQKL